MADYPSIPQSHESQHGLAEGTVMDRAEDGRPRFRDFYEQEWDEFVVVHDLIKVADRDALWAFWRANRRNSFTFESKLDGLTYTVRFLGAPKERQPEFQRWTITVQLVKV